MVTKRRKFELHKLTISGLIDGADYRKVIRDSRRKIRELKDAVWEHGGKSHALEEVELIKDRLHMRFLSFKTGYRPDILDTENYEIEPNPLKETQTGIDYTHSVLSLEKGRWILVIEKIQGGIYPNSVAQYINWMLDQTGVPNDLRQPTGEEIVVSIEPEPGIAFIKRIDSLERITKATLRIVRPNPGWADLESTLGDEASTSDAKHVDVTMAAKPRSTLKKTTGIVGRIKSLFGKKELGYAAVTGFKNGQEDKFTTEQMGQKATRAVELDERGQVIPSDAYTRMEKVLDNDEAK